MIGITGNLWYIETIQRTEVVKHGNLDEKALTAGL